MGRKPSLGTRYTRIGNAFRKYLQDKNLYDPTDEILIDELLFNIKISDDAKDDITERGYQINVVRDRMKKPYYQQNPSVGVYLSTSKNLGVLLTKLGITVQERARLSLMDEGEDPLAALMGGTLFSAPKQKIKEKE